MTEQEYQEIQTLIDSGLSMKKAAGTPSRRVTYINMRKKKGLAPVSTIPQPPSPAAVASIIREARIAANIDPTPPRPVEAPPVIDLRTLPPVDIQELAAMLKRAIYSKVSDAQHLDPRWARLGIIVCEKELPEWRNRGAEVAKDEYQSILESALKQHKGFQVLERKGNDNDVKSGDASKAGSPG